PSSARRTTSRCSYRWMQRNRRLYAHRAPADPAGVGGERTPDLHLPMERVYVASTGYHYGNNADDPGRINAFYVGVLCALESYGRRSCGPFLSRSSRVFAVPAVLGAQYGAVGFPVGGPTLCLVRAAAQGVRRRVRGRLPATLRTPRPDWNLSNIGLFRAAKRNLTFHR